jgi:hypothetical protein
MRFAGDCNSYRFSYYLRSPFQRRKLKSLNRVSSKTKFGTHPRKTKKNNNINEENYSFFIGYAYGNHNHG